MAKTSRQVAADRNDGGWAELARGRWAEARAIFEAAVAREETPEACEGLSWASPEGTFYLFASCAGVIGKRAPDGREIGTDRDFAAYLLDSVDVAVMPGEDLALSPYVRASFAKPVAVIEDAARRIGRACAALV